MKKFFILLGIILASFSLSAFVFIDWSSNPQSHTNTCAEVPQTAPRFNNLVLLPMTNSGLDYKVAPRFLHTITLQELKAAKTIEEILPADATKGLEHFEEVSVSIAKDEGLDLVDTKSGQGIELNPAQTKLLSSVGYSTDLHIRAACKERYQFTNLQSPYDLTYYMTIVPETQAKFEGGTEALIVYLREKSAVFTQDITKDQLKPGKVRFTVSKEGKVEGVKLTSTSGYPQVDQQLVELIATMPEAWTPAANGQGKSVSQELVFFFGLDGC